MDMNDILDILSNEYFV